MSNDEMRDNDLPTDGVSRQLALQRAAQIDDLRYRLSFELIPGAPRIKGRAVIQLKLANASQPLILDFRDLDRNGKVIEGAISDLKANNRPVNDLRQINGHIVIPARYFKHGENTISLKFETGLAPAGRPIISYYDRDDGSAYLYTLFVPMDASLAFPCFDQPDLKVRFKLDVTVPGDWAVISNTPLEKGETTGLHPADFQRLHFQETQPISTYLFAFAAGPFCELAVQGSPPDLPSPPLRLYVRKSKLTRAQEELAEVMQLTHEGMKHFIEFFDYQYPFSKYDQVLIPGFAYRGMEHAGATFLREDSILIPTTPTRSDQLNRASLLLHELAHQWFGNLVTMRWFDDLWLKEGFANFMAYHAMAAIYDRDDLWKRFYMAHKPLAYQIDSTKGATPIYQEVLNLKDAKSAYGAIVYQKAPSLLRSLSFLIGEEKFRDGVRLFLNEHAYANAEWNDLIHAFERSSEQKLEAWADVWIKRRGMPQIDVEWSCDAQGAIDRFELIQRDVLNEGGVWPIKTQVLLVYDDAQHVEISVQFETQRASAREAIGENCPAYVFANDGDFGYGLFMLDDRSRKAVTDRISKINDVFHRTMLWGALWDAVREGGMDPCDFIALALKSLTDENDEDLTQSLLDRVTRAAQRYLSKTRQTILAPQIESMCFERMMKSSGDGLRITYFRAFHAIATTSEAREKLKDLLTGKLVIPGIEIKQLDRWRIITSLLAQQDAQAESLLESERNRDTGDDSGKQAYIAGAAHADAATKRRYFNDYLKDRAIPEDWIEGSLIPFNSFNQSQLTSPFLGPALEALPQLKRERKIFFVLAWLNAFLIGQQSPQALDQVREFLRVKKIDRDLELKVMEVMDELERGERIRNRRRKTEQTEITEQTEFL